MSKADLAAHPMTELALGRKVVYMATRLYDYTQKLATVELESAVFDGLLDAALDLGIPMEKYPIFMPFRDTVENIRELDDSVNQDEKACAIYQDDLRRLARLYALVTFLNDPCKDDGICMEIGFAYGQRVPIVVVVTDFIHYSSISSPEIEFTLDPILLEMCGRVIHQTTISPARVPFPGDADLEAMKRVSADFAERLHEANRTLHQIVREHIKEMALAPSQFVSSHPNVHTCCSRPMVYVDFNGGLYEWSREYAKRLATLLCSEGLTVRLGRRHWPSWQARIAESVDRNTLAHQLGGHDLETALAADILILSGDGPEVDSGTAALQGAARALNKKIILYYSGNLQTNAGGRKPTARNLMLLYSPDRVARRLDEIPDLVHEVLRT